MKNFKALAFNLGVLAFAIVMVLSLTVGITAYSKLSFATSNQANVVASVNVPAVCGITLSPTAINFGSIGPGANTLTTVNGILDTNTGGDINANVLVSGTDWTWASGSVGNTMYSASSSTAYASGTPLPSTLTSVPSIWVGPGAANSIYFGLGIPIGTLAGIYTQTITIENTC